MKKESPEWLRTSYAAAMTLGFKNGRFYRGAKSPCVNLLLTYQEGCGGNCAYCGLSMKRPGGYTDKSFIRVGWPSYKLTDIIQGVGESGDKVKRICISMITNGRSNRDTINITKAIKKDLDTPVSLLISPTILNKDTLYDFKDAGADMIGVAVDCATPELFEKIRGRGVRGPHKWEKYWRIYEDSIEIFGKDMAGVHLIVGLGESESEMITTIQRSRDMGGSTHLFSFFPESDSQLADHPQPPMGQYRRIQLARYLIDGDIVRADDFSFDDTGRLTDYGIGEEKLSKIIDEGSAFMTSGCPGRDGVVACNRPYANCLPGPDIRNFPFLPEGEDIRKISAEIREY